MACISSRIATVIQVTERAIKGTITDLMSHSQFHCTGRVYLDLHGLIFETSICYWQDQPGSPRVCVCARAREARPTHRPTGRPPGPASRGGGRRWRWRWRWRDLRARLRGEPPRGHRRARKTEPPSGPHHRGGYAKEGVRVRSVVRRGAARRGGLGGADGASSVRSALPVAGRVQRGAGLEKSVHSGGRSYPPPPRGGEGA